MQITRSTYYSMKACEWLEKPKNYIYSPERTANSIAGIVKEYLKIALLSIPAAIGYGFSKAIYCVAGEKISDYDQQLSAWKNRITTATDEKAYSVGSFAAAAIDEQIRNRKKATDADEQTINSIRKQCITAWVVKPE